jgi:hypothetical protein
VAGTVQHVRRTIGPPDPLVRRHQGAQARERITAGADWEGEGGVFVSPIGGPLRPNTDFHVGKRLVRDSGVRDGRLRDARHMVATVPLILGVPGVMVDSIMEAGGAARRRARYMHVTGPVLRKVAQRVGDPD